MPAESPVMGEKVWSALANVPTAKVAETLNNDSQNLDGHKKSNNGVNGNSSHKHWQPHYYKGRPKKSPFTGPPFPVPVLPGVTYPPPGSFFPLVGGPESFYQPMPPFPIANNRLSKPGSQIPVKAFSSLPIMGDGQNCHPPTRRDQPVNLPKYSVERTHTTAEVGPRGGGHMYYWCPPPRPMPSGPKDSVTMQDNMRPTFARPSAFIGGPPFPGPGNLHYRPMHPPVFIQAPYPPWIAPHLVNPMSPQPEPLRLQEAIVKQIEYYFSDENLPTDRYLLSQMDDQGWVPISVIAGFKRVRRMCRDIHFILYALRWSSSVEVEGYKLRKYDSTAKNAAAAEDVSPANDVKNNLPCEDSTGANGVTADASSDDEHTCDLSPQKEEADIDAVVTEGMEQLLLPNVMSSGLTA